MIKTHSDVSVRASVKEGNLEECLSSLVLAMRKKSSNAAKTAHQIDWHALPSLAEPVLAKIGLAADTRAAILAALKSEGGSGADRNGKIRVLYQDGVYDGHYVNGVRQGRGKFLYDNGDTFDGQWEHDQQIKGKFMKTLGSSLMGADIADVYEGTFDGGLFHGEGTMRWNDGTVYTGGWVNGVRSGKGRMLADDTYEGEWENDQYHGQGKLTNDSYSFEGEFVKGKPTAGKMVWQATGDEYEGDYDKDLKPHGKGVMMFGDGGEKYVGSFKHGKMHGHGTFFYDDGQVFEGEFEDDERALTCSLGKLTFKDGKVYEGEFQDGKRTGHGKLTFPSGAVYEGDFVKGTRTGHGKYTFADGAVYEGQFKKNQRSGKGIYSKPNGERYSGEFVDGEYEGQGELHLPDGGHYVGTFKRGVFDGKGRWTLASGDVVEGEFVLGKFTNV